MDVQNALSLPGIFYWPMKVIWPSQNSYRQDSVPLNAWEEDN